MLVLAEGVERIVTGGGDQVPAVPAVHLYVYSLIHDRVGLYKVGTGIASHDFSKFLVPFYVFVAARALLETSKDILSQFIINLGTA